VVWLDERTFAAIADNGMARIDAATGSITAARCGWKFELANSPHTSGRRSTEPPCVHRRP
jgi:hypothetical protein